ncbi:MAG TPA: cytochrome c [Polyangiaceae bacterium]|nr:cytochrome c [Polyangiaceae bacterium]
MISPVRLAPAISLFLWACASELPEPRVENVDATRSQDQCAALAELRRGRELVVRNCAGCHALKTPQSLPKSAWNRVVDDMRRKHGVQLSDADASAIVTYMNQMASETSL